MVLVCICGAHQDHQCLHSLDRIVTVMDIMEVATRYTRQVSKRQNQPSICIPGYHISLVRRNVVSDCTKTGLVGMRRPARGICAHSEIGEESQCKAGRASF